MPKYAYGLIVVLIIILFLHWNIFGAAYEDYMFGYWIADESFCEEAEVTSMQLFIGEVDESGWFGRRKRNCYLAIGGITMQNIVIDYGTMIGTGFARKLPKYEISPTITFEEDCGIPETGTTFEFDMAAGILRIYAGEQMYGAFYKDNEISNILAAK